jgi:L-iditol 2-dehydrogenase
MKTVRLHGFTDLRLHDEPDPVAGVNEELINIKAVGICGSDLHWYTEGGIGDDQLNHALILGHEFSGISETGMRVTVDPAISCGSCELCRNGNPNLCEKVIFAGHGNTDGALCEKMAWEKKNQFVIPDKISYAEGAMLEPLGVAMHAVDLAHLQIGMTIGVYGCGTIGLLIIQLAKLAGVASIIATDKLYHRVEAAHALGALMVLVAKDGLEIQEIMSATGNRGVDVAFEVAGEQEAVEVAFLSIRPGGKVILAGIPADNRTSFPASVARRKGLTIKIVRRMKNTYPRAIEMVSEGLVDVRSLITHRFPLDKFAEAFETAQRREGIKVIIEL